LELKLALAQAIAQMKFDLDGHRKLKPRMKL
jgi:hypothetical protein